MYPRLSDFIENLLGVDLPFDIYSFGAMVAIAILTASWIAARELDRMYANGLIGGVKVQRPNEKGKRPATEEVSPSTIMGAVTLIAVFGGFAGAKLFHILENLDNFSANPGGMIFSTGGFTFYGGLIVATSAIVWLVRKKGLSVGRFTDAAGPTLILAYGIGRIGCYLAGDGDWGVCSDLDDKPSWVPTALWSETFDRNILGPDGTSVDVLAYMNCPVTADGVYPTMLYEFGMGVLLFATLWSIRKHRHVAGWLFAVYLLFAGVERFLIEQIRVNNEYPLLGMQVTQAEVISVILILVGAAAAWWLWSPRGRNRMSESVEGADASPPTGSKG